MNADDALFLLLFLMWQASEIQRLEDENKELRRVILAEYEWYSRGTSRLREFRYPVQK